jgi:gluconate:H+ symporter, GntP family
MRPIGNEPDPAPLDDSQLPSLFWSLAPVLLPVILISTNTVLTTIADAQHAAQLSPADFTDFPAWREIVRRQATTEAETPGKRLLEVIQDPAAGNGPQRERVAALLVRSEPLNAEEIETLIDGVNRFVLPVRNFHRGAEEPAFLTMPPNPVARKMIGLDRLKMKSVDAERLNRALLESAYPEFIHTHDWDTEARRAADLSSLFGNASLALLLSTVIAMVTLLKQRGLSLKELGHAVEVSLMSGGVIILITSAGGAFGAMLTVANVGEAIRGLFQVTPGQNAGMMFLLLGFSIAAVLKVAQGSGTVAMITGAAMLAGVASPETLGFSPVYLATAIGAGSLVGSWMNDSGFWIFAKMGGLSEVEALKSWTVLLIALGFSSLLFTIILSQILPLA